MPLPDVTTVQPYHVPVMIAEVLDALDPRPGQTIVDATLGGGGHARAIAERLQPGGRLIGIDQDPDAVAEAKRALADLGGVVTVVSARFDAIGTVLDSLGLEKADGFLFDLGVSSYQLDTPSRGFSFKDPGAPLDMRMNPASGGLTAADLLNTLDTRALAALIREHSDERWAGRIAQFVGERRKDEPYRTVGQLIETVLAAMPRGARPDDKHPATRTFQAMRIAVNDELSVLGHALESAADRLTKGGIITALSYHSTEDRVVKQAFARLAGRGEGEGPYGTRPPAMLELLGRKPVEPSAAEVAANPRARSAKLRAARRL
jgi:16S rRNA (cytosine1402-N4)-methyltransferase